MNMRSMSAPHYVDTKRRKRIDWLAVALICAAAMVAATMVYKFLTP